METTQNKRVTVEQTCNALCYLRCGIDSDGEGLHYAKMFSLFIRGRLSAD